MPDRDDAIKVWRTPDGVRRGFTDCRFGQIHYRIARPSDPTRFPLVCFHLSPSSGRMFSQFVQEMGRDRVAVAPDTIGFGESSTPTEPKEIEDFAACAGELLDGLGIGTVDLLGIHTGSEIAVETARQRPDQVRRVIIVSAPIFTDEDLVWFRDHYKGIALTEDGTHLKQHWGGHWKWRGPGVDANLNQLTVAEVLRGTGEQYAWGHRAAFNYPFGERLAEVTQPILVLNPEDDLNEHTKRAAPLLRNGRILDLPKDTFGHGMFVTRTKEVAEIVREFLDDGAQEDGVDPNDGKKKAVASPAGAPDFVSRAFTDSRWGQLHYRTIRPAKDDRKQRPLICLHASPRSGRAYINLMQAIGNDRIAIAPDTPGFGESEPPPEPVEIGDFADVMAEFLMKQDFESVDVFGFHTGSEVATELWHRLPKVVSHIVMYSAPIFSEEELVAFREAYTPIEFDENGMHNLMRWQAFWKWLGPEQTIENYADAFNETLRWGPAYSWGHRAAFNYPMAKRLKQVNCPVLVLNPEDDLYEQSKRAADVIQKGRVHDLPGFGHAMMDTRTEEIAALVRDFVDD